MFQYNNHNSEQKDSPSGGIDSRNQFRSPGCEIDPLGVHTQGHPVFPSRQGYHTIYVRSFTTPFLTACSSLQVNTLMHWNSRSHMTIKDHWQTLLLPSHGSMRDYSMQCATQVIIMKQLYIILHTFVHTYITTMKLEGIPDCVLYIASPYPTQQHYFLCMYTHALKGLWTGSKSSRDSWGRPYSLKGSEPGVSAAGTPFTKTSNFIAF